MTKGVVHPTVWCFYCHRRLRATEVDPRGTARCRVHMRRGRRCPGSDRRVWVRREVSDWRHPGRPWRPSRRRVVRCASCGRPVAARWARDGTACPWWHRDRSGALCPGEAVRVPVLDTHATAARVRLEDGTWAPVHHDQRVRVPSPPCPCGALWRHHRRQGDVLCCPTWGRPPEEISSSGY